MTAVDTAVDYSSYFRLICEGGLALDNVSVRGTLGPLDIITTTTSDTTSTLIPIEILVAIVAIPLVVIVLVLLWKRKGG
jgi:hypothetical protein